jgi:CubicO group peptidase (beta-lactamase class C family)
MIQVLKLSDVKDIIDDECKALIRELQNPPNGPPNDNNYVVAVAYLPPGARSPQDARIYWTQPEGAEPYSQNSAFAIASVTKTFTATLLGYGDACSTDFAHNSDSGQYQMNTFLKPYLNTGTNLSPWVQNMSLRMLAQHMSGFFDNLPDGKPPFPDGSAWGSALFNGTALNPPTSLLEFFEHYPSIGANESDGTYPGSYPPGSCWQYSDMGFVTLGYALVMGFKPLVQSLGISSSEYPALLGELITKWLSMSETFAGQQPPNPNPTVNLPAFFNGKVVKGGSYAAPDIKTTVRDIGNWVYYNLYPDTIVEQPYLGAGLRYATTPFDPRIQCTPGDVPACLPCVASSGQWGPPSMGLAWQASELSSEPQSPQLIWKNGGSSTGGCSTWVGLIPNGEPSPIGLAIMANGWWKEQTNDIHVSVDKTGLCLLQHLYSEVH